MQLTRSLFDLMKETTLQNDVLIPLFRAMGFRDVKRHDGGPNELGKDLVMWRDDDLRERVNYGVVVKAEKITGQATGTKNSANTVLFQVMQTFNEPYPDLTTGEEQTIQQCLVISSKEISKEAINAIKGTLRKNNLDKITTFIDGDELWPWFKGTYPRKVFWQRLNRLNRSLRHYSKRQAYPTIFVLSRIPKESLCSKPNMTMLLRNIL